jgi:hypothetical protein
MTSPSSPCGYTGVGVLVGRIGVARIRGLRRIRGQRSCGWRNGRWRVRRRGREIFFGRTLFRSGRIKGGFAVKIEFR